MNSIGGRRLGLPNIVKMLRTTSSTKRTFICIDALDECVLEHRTRLLDSLNQIMTAGHHSVSLLRVGARESSKYYYLDETTPTPTNQITMVKHHSGGLLGMDMREW